MASNLEQSFRDLAARHNLHAINIGLLIPNDLRRAGWNVSLQRWRGGVVVGCWQSNGDSIATALAEAIAQVDAPLTDFADNPLPELAA